MITRLTLKNFKRIKEQTYDFNKFNLLVGGNNSGKSTVLQSMAIWQYCIDEFLRAKRKGKRGLQIVLPNFTALPVPEFNLLWNERTDRYYPTENGQKKQIYILVEIVIEWKDNAGKDHAFGVNLRYGSPLAIYAIPIGGFKELDKSMEMLPNMAYMPPFSGLEPEERWQDEGPLREQIGKAQPGSILRNLLLRVWEKNKDNWKEIQKIVNRWFNVELNDPQYRHGVDTKIICEYDQGKKSYDIISGGSGFHQTLTLLAFLYGYHPTTILLDEPDAHLHVNLQREILGYFIEKSSAVGTQFLIATHAEEFAKGVDASQIISLISGKPKRVESKESILTAMADVSNVELSQLQECPLIIYVEGESDIRILKGWARECQVNDFIHNICFRPMGGGPKNEMKLRADKHFEGVRHAISKAKRLMLFDFDNEESAFNPESDNPVLCEWKRKNIENYLLVSDVWVRSVEKTIGAPTYRGIPRLTIKDFFKAKRLTLQQGESWQSVNADIFRLLDGKKILFENNDSLFNQLRNKHEVDALREDVAASMRSDEIHEDVHVFFTKLRDTYESLR